MFLSASLLFAVNCAKKSTTSSTDGASNAPVAVTAPVVTVALDAGSASQTQNACFAVTATAIGSSASAVSAEQSATFSLATTSGTGTFYSDSGCSNAITSATIAQGQSTLTLYFKSTTIEQVAIRATYNSAPGATWSGTIYGPNPNKSSMASTVKNNTCTPVSFYFLVGSSVTPVTYSTTVTLTQTSGNAVTFYTGAGCTSTALTTSGVTTFTVPSGSSGLTLYGSCGAANQNFVFSSNWGYTQNGVTTSASNTVFYQNW